MILYSFTCQLYTELKQLIEAQKELKVHINNCPAKLC